MGSQGKKKGREVRYRRRNPVHTWFPKPLFRCILSEEVQYVMAVIHERLYGNHSKGRELERKVLRVGYNIFFFFG